MLECIECGQLSQPTEVYNGIQIYECPNGHRWGIVPSTDVEATRQELKEAA